MVETGTQTPYLHSGTALPLTMESSMCYDLNICVL